MASPLANLRAMVSTANRSAGSGRRVDPNSDDTMDGAHQSFALLPAIYYGPKVPMHARTILPQLQTPEVRALAGASFRPQRTHMQRRMSVVDHLSSRSVTDEDKGAASSSGMAELAWVQML